VLASFDGPARAVYCALALRDQLRSLGLEIRAELHTGEIERRGDRVDRGTQFLKGIPEEWQVLAALEVAAAPLTALSRSKGRTFWLRRKTFAGPGDP
jgi:hypothetical protein